MVKKKGLCSTCVHDKECCFSRKTIIWQCEEFGDDVPVKEFKSKAPGPIKSRQAEELEVVCVE